MSLHEPSYGPVPIRALSLIVKVHKANTALGSTSCGSNTVPTIQAHCSFWAQLAGG